MSKQKDSDDYERFISSLVEDIKKSGRDIRDRNYGRRNVVKGASGQKHQIDVSFYDYSFPEPTIVLIECKRVADPVPLSVVKIAKATFFQLFR